MSNHDEKCEFLPSQFMNEESCHCYERKLEKRIADLECLIREAFDDGFHMGRNTTTVTGESANDWQESETLRTIVELKTITEKE
jgi:hypothetical protein